MRLTMTTGIDAGLLQRELVDACSAMRPDDGFLCPRAIFKALLAGTLDDAVVAAQWGTLEERRRLHPNDEARLAFDAAAAALVLPGPWFVPFDNAAA